MKDRFGMRIHWLCWATRRHKYPRQWNPVGHIEGAVWQPCERGCGTGRMRYVEGGTDQ